MNKIRVICFLMIFMGSIFLLSADLPDSLITYFPFNRDAIDMSGNGNDGTISGVTLTADRFGNPNGAFAFDGSNDFILVQDTLDLRLIDTDFTFSAWVYETARNSSYQDAVMVKRGHGYEDGWFWSITGNAGDFGPGKMLYQVSGGNDPESLSSSIIPLFSWTHLLIVYHIGSNTVDMYINGELDATGFDIPPPNADTYENLYIGQDSASAYNNYNFHGVIDDIMIFDRALSEAEIDSLYNQSGWLQHPVNLNISVIYDSVFLDWDAVPEAISYRVYSDTDAYGSFSTIEWTGSETSWSEPVIEEKRFYFVTGLN